MSTHEVLEQAFLAIRSGDRRTARDLLTEILRSDPNNARAWLLLSDVVDSHEQRRQCLYRALSADPSNEAARTRLSQLGVESTGEPGSGDHVEPLATPTRSLSSLLETEMDHSRSIATRMVSEAHIHTTEARRKNGYRNATLAGAMLLALGGGLILLAVIVTIIVPQARDRLGPTPAPVLYTATLWCPACSQSKSPIVLWERIGDGISRGDKAGELAHDTTVSVLVEGWSEPEQRAYYWVQADGQAGWVPDTFIRR